MVKSGELDHLEVHLIVEVHSPPQSHLGGQAGVAPSGGGHVSLWRSDLQE